MDYLIESKTELAKAMDTMVIYLVNDEIVQLPSLQLANGLLQLKSLFEQMQLGDWLAKCLDTNPHVEAL